MIPDGVAMDSRKQTFYISTGKGWRLVSGYAVVYKGIRMVVHRDFFFKKDEKLSFSRKWTVSNYETGLRIGGLDVDLDKAIEAAVKEIEKYGVDNVRELIKKKMSDGVPPYEGGI